MLWLNATTVPMKARSNVIVGESWEATQNLPFDSFYDPMPMANIHGAVRGAVCNLFYMKIAVLVVTF